MRNEGFYHELEGFFLALADKTRLRILQLIQNGEVSVNEFTNILGESQPKISRHLAYLRNSGLVTTRRDGKSIYYRIQQPDNLAARNILEGVIIQMSVNHELISQNSGNLGNRKIPSADYIYDKPHVTYQHPEIETYLL